MSAWEPWLERWHKAGLLDEEAVGRIRAHEAGAPAGQGYRWPILIALAFGVILLGAGILLFISAHWDEMSPGGRIAVVIGALAAVHLAGAWFAERFGALSSALHAVGTVACGGGIFLAAQIFNLEEHWPNGVLLWAVAAAAGWYLLRSWPQWMLLALAVPFWLAGEFTEKSYHDWRISELFVLLTCLCYLSARAGADKEPRRRVLGWIGGIWLLPATMAAALEHGGLEYNWHLAAAIVLPLLAGYYFRGKEVVVLGGWTVWAIGLVVIADLREYLLVHVWCALGAVGMAAWGIRDSRPERVNLGLAGFAITVMFFYFSTLMDKMGRSASLIALGVLFLGGGWALERLRRRLMARMEGGA